MISTNRTNINFLCKTPLYLRDADGSLVLFKKPGVTVGEAGLSLDDLPGRLFIKPEHKLKALNEIQAGLNALLKERLDNGDVVGVRTAMVDLMEATLSDPRSGSLEGVGEMVQNVSQHYADQPQVLQSLANMSYKDYTTALHSVNVMALTLAHCAHWKMSLPVTQTIGLAALMHDVGKTQIPTEILTSPKKLSEEEFAAMRAHTTKGYNILRRCDFPDKAVALGAWQHHEKLDGSGYPKGISDISPVGRLLSIVDCFEAVTADERPYRQAMDPFPALQLIKGDVDIGKLDGGIFDKFVQSLT